MNFMYKYYFLLQFYKFFGEIGVILAWSTLGIIIDQTANDSLEIRGWIGTARSALRSFMPCEKTALFTKALLKFLKTLVWVVVHYNGKTLATKRQILTNSCLLRQHATGEHCTSAGQTTKQRCQSWRRWLVTVIWKQNCILWQCHQSPEPLDPHPGGRHW